MSEHALNIGPAVPRGPGSPAVSAVIVVVLDWVRSRRTAGHQATFSSAAGASDLELAQLGRRYDPLELLRQGRVTAGTWAGRP